ncbi:MAG: ester cyclase [Gammaproteobacteria bacterium]
MSEGNKDLIRRFYKTVWDQGDLAAIDHLFANDFVNHDPDRGEAPDREAFKRYVEYARRTADYRPTIEDLIAEEDKVVARLTGRGRVKRKFLGITLVDRKITQPGIVIWRVSGGKIVERWARWA